MTASGVRGLLRRGRDEDIKRGVMLGTAGTLGLNVTATGLNFAIVLLLSRLLGAEGFGAYASAFAWASILSVVAVLGLTPLVVRQIAAYRTVESWGLLRGLLRRTNEAVALSSALSVAAAAAVGWGLYRSRPELLHPFWIALLLVPLIALTSVRQAAMQGLGRVVLGRVPETSVAPLLFIAFAALAALALGDEFSASWATASQVGAFACAFVLGAVLLRRSLPPAVRSSAAEYDMVSWRRSGVPLLLLNVVMAANAQVGTILLGALGTAAEAGVFNVAFRTTTFIGFVMLAATYPLMPVVARLHAAGELDRLRAVVIRSARGVLLFAAPTGLVLVVFAPAVLGLFGAGFETGSSALRILAIGEVVNVLTGFGGLVLVMTGHERELARSVVIGAALNVTLTAVLIPSLGVEGAAVGTAAGVVASNLLMTWWAWRRLSVWAVPVGPAPG